MLACPAELDEALPTRRPIPDGAVSRGNDLYNRWVDGELSDAGYLRQLILDARAACAAARLVDPAGLP